MEIVYKRFEDKLHDLVSFLKRLPVELERVVYKIDNDDLKNAVNAVILNSYEYVSQLNMHLQKYQIKIPAHQLIYTNEISFADERQTNLIKGAEIINICEKAETYLTKLNEEVLKEFFPNNSLKNILDYQLVNIQEAFKRIRFLNTMRLRPMAHSNQ